MMKLKMAVVCAAVLLLGACESNETGNQQVAPPTPVVEQEKAAPAEQPVVEQATPQETTPPASQPAVVAVSQPLSGEAIYKKSCVACHATGSANAPKLGNKEAWKPRIDKGMDVLLQSAINGVPGTAMMKRGTCLTCTDDDLKAAIAYMVSQSQ